MGLDPLSAVVCGFENSGTTLVGAILRAHPQLDSGFEGGLLLGHSPREFFLHRVHFKIFLRGWQLTREELLRICDTDDWGEAYRRARQQSPLIANKQAKIFDKTPAYMRFLKLVLGRVPGLPCVVNVRDPRAMMASWAKRTGYAANPEEWVRTQLPAFCQRYVEYAQGYMEAVSCYGQRIELIQFEEACLDPAAVFSRVFAFLGLDFDPSFLKFGETFKVHGTGISQDYMYPHRALFSERVCEQILDRTREFECWHFTGQRTRCAA